MSQLYLNCLYFALYSNPVGFNIAAKDFGASWRDGRLFLSMIHTIEPELIDPEEVEKKTNKQNLEYAFDTAENRLGIPRLLEPEGLLIFLSYLLSIVGNLQQSKHLW